jgi:hypothetical protein
MPNDLRPSTRTTATWNRGLYMLLFAFFYSLAEFILVVVCIYQFVSGLITGNLNHRLLLFSEDLCTYIVQILSYETFRTEQKPFPFSQFPETYNPIDSQP